MARQVQAKRMARKSRRSGYKPRGRTQSRQVTIKNVKVQRGVGGLNFGFPDVFKTRLRYCDEYTLTGAAGVVTSQIFVANGLYDTDLSGSGHQPRYFDTVCGAAGGTAVYNRYRVLGSKIKVTFMANSPPPLAVANYGPIVVFSGGTIASALAYSTTTELMEASDYDTNFIDSKSGNNKVVTTMTFSPERDLGIEKGDTALGAAYNANPGQRYQFIIGKVDTTGTSTVKAFVEIEYLAEFFDRNEVAQS